MTNSLTDNLLDTITFTPCSLSFPDAWVGHIPFAAWLLRAHPPRLLVELGTHTGNSYFAFCQAVADYHLSTRCYAVDTWQGDEHAGHYSDEIYHQVAAHNQEHYAAFSRLLRMTFDEALDYFAEGTIDLLHIDGLHTYEAVRHDYESWRPKVTPGGFILFHDTTVRERGFGVWRLWQELTAIHPYHIEFPHSNGLGVLWIPPREGAAAPAWIQPGHAEQARMQRLFAALGERLVDRYHRFEQERRANELQARADELLVHLQNLQREHAQTLTSLNHIDQERSTLRRALDELYASRSWRLTRPLRFGARFARALAHGDLAEAKAQLRLILERIPPLRALYLRLDSRQLQLRRFLSPRHTRHQRAYQALAERRIDPMAISTAFPALEPSDWPEIDLTLVTYHSARWLPGFLASLLAQRYPLEKIRLIIVDHGSTDQTLPLLRDWIASRGARLRGIDLLEQPNLGFGAGHDRAIRHGNAPYCLVANADLEFHPDTLTTLVRHALADHQAQVASWEARQIPYEHPKHYDPVTLETPWSSHACILLRRSAYERVGGYDPRLFMYAEDVELSYRFRSYGYALKYVPRASVTHHSYQTPGEHKALQRTGNAAGNLLIRWRYGRWSDRLEGLALAAALLLRHLTDPDVRTPLVRAYARILKCRAAPHLAGPAPVAHPFNGFDYVLARTGAFWPVQPIPADRPLPLVSLIIRTYHGRETYLRQALASALQQTYPALEILVTEDGGEAMAPIVAEFTALAPPGVTLTHIPNPKLGRSAIANRALAQARGQYLMFLDDDDLLYADHIQTLLTELLAHPDCPAAYALAFEVLTAPAAMALGYREIELRLPSVLQQPWDYPTLLDHNYLPIQSVLFHRTLYETRGGFDETLDALEDWNLWLRYGTGYTFCYVPKVTSLYRTPADPAERERRQWVLHRAYYHARQAALTAIPTS